MKPIKTKPMSRKVVKNWITATLTPCDMSDLHDSNKLARFMVDLSECSLVPNYDRVMDALLHFWKTST